MMGTAGWDISWKTLAWGLFNHITSPAHLMSHLNSWLHNHLRDQVITGALAAAVFPGSTCGSPALSSNPWPHAACYWHLLLRHTWKYVWACPYSTEALPWEKSNRYIKIRREQQAGYNSHNQTIKTRHHQRPNNWRWRISRKWLGTDGVLWWCVEVRPWNLP